VNIGSEEMVSIDQLADMVIKIAGKKLTKKHVAGPQGVRGRNSDNRLIYGKLKWKPTQPLAIGMGLTYTWIENQVKK
jgi:GDP-D-mannose 3',5'-epimerase